MRVRFWGVRGTVPWATSQAMGYGCNTPCVELADPASGDMLVLDAGSGLVGLGQALDSAPRGIAVLLTHYHWDHLQGLPFFGALYQPGWAPVIWAPTLDTYDSACVAMAFGSPYFPVPFDKLPAPPVVRPVAAGRAAIGPFDVRAVALNHPGGSLAYRVPGSAGDLVYATDHEPGDEAIDARLAKFVAGARVIIFDAHFTPEEAPAHRGWGHSTWLEAARLAAAAGAERLWLFHHKPGRTDTEVDEIEWEARKVFQGTSAAREGDVFEV